MKRKIYFITILVILGSTGFAHSEEKLSLRQALEMAFEQNPALVAARKDIQIADAQYKISKKWDNPELEVEVGNLAKDLEGDSSFSTRDIDSEIRLTQGFDGWGKKGLKKKIAESGIKQQEAEFRNIWGQTVKQVKAYYTQTILKKKAIDLARENLKLSQKFLDQTKLRFDSGDALSHQWSRAKLEVIRARNELLSAQKQHVIKKGEFNLLLGRPIHTSYELIDYFQIENLDHSYEELLARALMQRGDISVQESEVDKKIKEWKLAKRDRLPSYDVSLFVEREEEVYKGGVGVAFELPIWNFHGPEIQQAKLEQEKAEDLLSLLQSEVTLEVYTIFHETDLAKKSHDIAIEAIKEANEILRFTTTGYEEGEISFLSYLENIKVYQETQQSYFESLSEYAIKIAELEQAIGEVALSKEYSEGRTSSFQFEMTEKRREYRHE